MAEVLYNKLSAAEESTQRYADLPRVDIHRFLRGKNRSGGLSLGLLDNKQNQLRGP
jgi:hypothetical protein